MGASGSTFVTQLPMRDGSYYGSLSSIYSGATCNSPLSGDPDPFNRVVHAFKPDCSEVSTGYHGLRTDVTLHGIQVSPSQQQDSTTTYTKDILGRLLLVQPPAGASALYSYDALGNMVQTDLLSLTTDSSQTILTNGVAAFLSGKTTQRRSFVYDGLGRLRSATNPENGTTNFTAYAPLGKLLEAQDANGQAQGYRLVSTYDPAGRLLATVKRDANGDHPLITNIYDVLDGSTQGASYGKLVKSVSYQAINGAQDVPSTELFSYDTTTGRVNYQGQATEAGGGYEENGITPSYDQYGQVTEESLPGMGAVLGNVYSHGALVSRLQNGNPVLSNLQYDAAGAMTEIDFATGEVEKIALDQYERPIGFNFSDPGNVQRWGNGYYANPAGPDHGLDYVYDGAGNIASIGSAQGVTDNFTYDLLSRLTNATINRAGYAHAYSYGYDAFGNLLGRTEALQNGAANLKASIMNTAGYRVPSQTPDETAATNYIKEVAFSAQLAAGSNGVTNNRLSSITRGGSVMGVDTGLSQESASMVYDANGNLTDDGKYLYGYDALNRQVSVTDKASNLLVAEYAYLASGERIAAVKYTGGEASDYTRYVREGGAVVWEKTDSTGHEKRYIYAGGRMAYTQEAWDECSFPRTLSQTQTLATSSVTPDANGQTVTATVALPGLPEEANAVEVRLVKGNSLVSSQRIDRPEGGQWCGVEQAAFAGLVEGNDYQAGITLFFREGRAKVMPLRAYLVQRMKLGIVKGKLAAWTIKRLKADNDNVTEETTTGFAGLAPEGAEDYTALAGHSGAMEEVAQGRQVDEAQVPQGTASVNVQGSAGTSMSLAAPSLGSATLNGGIIIPQCTRHALNTYYATDHLGTVRFTKTIDETGTEVGTSTHDYEPFGVEITPTDECDNTHKFTGHERDAETGNDYMHFRFFSASMGRFQKPDSNFDNPTNNPQGWNLYSYVKGNPVNFNDPTGHYVRSTMQTQAFLQERKMMAMKRHDLLDLALEHYEEARLAFATHDDKATGNPTPAPPPDPTPKDPGATPPTPASAPAATPAAQAPSASTPLPSASGAAQSTPCDTTIDAMHTGKIIPASIVNEATVVAEMQFNVPYPCESGNISTVGAAEPFPAWLIGAYESAGVAIMEMAKSQEGAVSPALDTGCYTTLKSSIFTTQSCPGRYFVGQEATVYSGTPSQLRDPHPVELNWFPPSERRGLNSDTRFVGIYQGH